MFNWFIILFSNLVTVVLCLFVIQINGANLNCKGYHDAVTSLYVESRVQVGAGTTLKCFIGLKGPKGKLVNLKWYVNDTEFYRYEPTANGRNNVKQFKVKGVKIDESQTLFDPTNGSILRLANLTYSSSGIYKCEVTKEPCFETGEKHSHLYVVKSKKRGYFEKFGLYNGSCPKLVINFNYLIIWFLLVYSRLWLAAD